MSVWGIVVAAGRGERAGLGRNKVFFPLHGRSVLSRCVDAVSYTHLFVEMLKMQHLVLYGVDVELSTDLAYNLDKLARQRRMEHD